MQEMLLDSNAEQISDNELPEILSILPSFKDMNLLELGAGIGFVYLSIFVFSYSTSISNHICIYFMNRRFTRDLAEQAKHVTAVDFIENAYFDVVYSRDSLLHVSDKAKNFRKFYDWLKPGGKVFFTDYMW